MRQNTLVDCDEHIGWPASCSMPEFSESVRTSEYKQKIYDSTDVTSSSKYTFLAAKKVIIMYDICCSDNKFYWKHLLSAHVMINDKTWIENETTIQPIE